MKNLMILLYVIAFITNCSTMNEEFKGLTYKSLQLPKKIKYKKLLKKEEFKKDILILRYALKKAYGGKGTISDSIFKNVNRSLKELPFISSPKELCKKIGIILNSFPDNHLKAKYRGSFCYKRKIKITNVGSNLNDTKNPWKGIKTKDNIYTIAVSNFPSGRWPGFLPFLKEAMEEGKAIIIDLRGNEGGDDSTGLKLAERLAGQEIELPFASDIRRNTPETLTIWDNNLTLIKKNSKNKNMIERLNIYIEENNKKMEKTLVGNIDEFTSKKLNKVNGSIIN